VPSISTQQLVAKHLELIGLSATESRVIRYSQPQTKSPSIHLPLSRPAGVVLSPACPVLSSFYSRHSTHSLHLSIPSHSLLHLKHHSNPLPALQPTCIRSPIAHPLTHRHIARPVA
jgi:hypothetical protein